MRKTKQRSRGRYSLSEGWIKKTARTTSALLVLVCLVCASLLNDHGLQSEAYTVRVMLYMPPGNSARYFIVCFLGILFSLLIWRAHRESRSHVSLLLLWAIGLGTVGFGFRAIPLLFTQDNLVYTQFYSVAIVFTHVALFLFSVTYLYLIGIRPTIVVGVWYVAIMSAVSTAGMVLTLVQLQETPAMIGSNLTFTFSGPLYLLYGFMFLPFIAFGIHLVNLARTVPTRLSYIRITALGSVLVLLGLSGATGSARSFFSSPRDATYGIANLTQIGFTLFVALGMVIIIASTYTTLNRHIDHHLHPVNKDDS